MSNVDRVSVRLTVNQNQDRRRYNLPTSDEIAVVVPGDETQTSGSRDIILRRRDGPLQRAAVVVQIFNCNVIKVVFGCFNRTDKVISHDFRPAH